MHAQIPKPRTRITTISHRSMKFPKAHKEGNIRFSANYKKQPPTFCFPHAPRSPRSLCIPQAPRTVQPACLTHSTVSARTESIYNVDHYLCNVAKVALGKGVWRVHLGRRSTISPRCPRHRQETQRRHNDKCQYPEKVVSIWNWGEVFQDSSNRRIGEVFWGILDICQGVQNKGDPESIFSRAWKVLARNWMRTC